MATVAEEATKPSTLTLLPPYPEMILMAIQKIGEKNGLNKSAIADYIESNYAELPETHSALLAAHLARMKESGELLLIKNNYYLPGLDAPPKRGRGRPPKLKQPFSPGSITANNGVASAAAAASPRPRGRPPKPKDPLAMAVAKASNGLPRRRGRPSKAAVRPADAFPGAAAVAKTTTAKTAAVAPIVGVKRGRGRPPKSKVAVARVNA